MKNNFKFIFLVLFFSLFLLPCGVMAAEYEDAYATFSCPSTMKKNASAECDVVIHFTGDETYTNVTGSIGIDGTSVDVPSNLIDKDGSWGADDTLEVGVTITSGSTTGYTELTLSNLAIVGDVTGSIALSDNLPKTVKVLNNVKTLESITIDEELITGFSSDDYSYDLTYSKSSIDIDAEPTALDETISGIGEKTLVCGSNRFIVNAEAEDGTSQNYTLNVTRSCSSDTTLKSITLSSGSLSPTYKSTVYEYEVDVADSVDKITIVATKNDSTQTISGVTEDASLNYGENEFNIKVTAENGSSKTYNIVVNRELPENVGVYLLSLELSEGIINFNKTVLNYDIKVLNEVSKVEIKATPEDSTTEVQIVGDTSLVVGENEIKIILTTQENLVQTYVLNIERLKVGETLGDNANVLDIDVEGYEINFEQETKSYNIKIEDEDSLKISVQLEDESASYVIEGNEDLKNGSKIRIKVTSKDGTTNEYVINIEKDSTLIYIIVGAVVLAALIILTIILIVKNIKGNDNNKQKKMKKDSKKTIKGSKKENNKDDKLIARANDLLNDKQEVKTEAKENVEQTKVYQTPIINKTNSLENDILDVTAPTKEEILHVEKNINDQVQDIKVPFIEKEVPEIVDLNKEETLVDDSTEDELLEVEYKKCKICGHQIPKSAKVCPYCKVNQ